MEREFTQQLRESKQIGQLKFAESNKENKQLEIPKRP